MSDDVFNTRNDAKVLRLLLMILAEAEPSDRLSLIKRLNESVQKADVLERELLKRTAEFVKTKGRGE